MCTAVQGSCKLGVITGFIKMQFTVKVFQVSPLGPEEDVEDEAVSGDGPVHSTVADSAGEFKQVQCSAMYYSKFHNSTVQCSAVQYQTENTQLYNYTLQCSTL